MEMQLVYQKLKQFFPHQLQNINISQLKLSSPSSFESMIGKKLPYMPLNQVHMLCRNQQKNVMNRVLEVKEKDLYEEMKQVCPNNDLKNIRSFSHEEMNVKIQYYTTQMNAIQQKEMQSQTDQPDSDMIDIEEQVEIQDLHHEINHDQNRELRNIFEEYDHHLPWNELGIYDLH